MSLVVYSFSWRVGGVHWRPRFLYGRTIFFAYGDDAIRLNDSRATGTDFFTA